jgi:hypothetical protein
MAADVHWGFRVSKYEDFIRPQLDEGEELTTGVLARMSWRLIRSRRASRSIVYLGLTTRACSS